LCGDKRYVDVRAQRPSGLWYVTPFLQCVGCTGMFREPFSFSGLHVRAESNMEDMRTAGSYGAMPNAKKDDEA